MERRAIKAAALLNNLKHETAGMLRFFSDEKNFDQDQKVNEGKADEIYVNSGITSFRLEPSLAV